MTAFATLTDSPGKGPCRTNSTAFKEVVHLLLESSASHIFVETLQALRRDCQKDPATCPSRASRIAWDWQLQLHQMQINPSAAHPVVMSAIKKVECQIHSQVPIQELLQQAVCETTNLCCLYRLWEAGGPGGPGGLAGPDVIPPGPTSIARGVLAIASTLGLLWLWLGRATGAWRLSPSWKWRSCEML